MKVGIYVLCLTLEEKLYIFVTKKDIYYICHIWSFLCRYMFISSHFGESFTSKMNVKSFQKASLHQIDLILRFLSFLLFMWFNWFINVESSLYLWNRSHLTLLTNVWIWFAKTALRIFAYMCIKNVGLQFPFLISCLILWAGSFDT